MVVSFIGGGTQRCPEKTIGLPQVIDKLKIHIQTKWCAFSNIIFLFSNMKHFFLFCNLFCQVIYLIISNFYSISFCLTSIFLLNLKYNRCWYTVSTMADDASFVIARSSLCLYTSYFVWLRSHQEGHILLLWYRTVANVSVLVHSHLYN